MPLINERCHNVAIDCAESGDEICPDLAVCDAAQQRFARTAIDLYQALLVADLALAAGDDAEALVYIGKATDLIKEIRLMLNKFGLRE